MKLATTSVRPNNWVIIEGAAPSSTDLSTQYVKLNDQEIPAFVDGKNLLVRCPDFKDRGTVTVSVRGISLGSVEISR